MGRCTVSQANRPLLRLEVTSPSGAGVKSSRAETRDEGERSVDLCIAMSTLGYCYALLLLLRWQCPVLIREVSCGVIAPSHIAVQSLHPGY